MTKKNKKFNFFPLFLFFSSLILIVAGLMASIEESFNMHLPYIAFGFGLLLISLSWLKEGIVALKIASVAATTIAILLAAFLWGWTYIKILVVFLVCLSIILVISIFIKRSKQKIKRK